MVDGVAEGCEGHEQKKRVQQEEQKNNGHRNSENQNRVTSFRLRGEKVRYLIER